MVNADVLKLRKTWCIVGCDILQDYPSKILLILSPQVIACSQTYSEYKVAVKKLVSLLKPGGFLTMFVDECSTHSTWLGKRSGVLCTLQWNKEKKP